LSRHELAVAFRGAQLRETLERERQSTELPTRLSRSTRSAASCASKARPRRHRIVWGHWRTTTSALERPTYVTSASVLRRFSRGVLGRPRTPRRVSLSWLPRTTWMRRGWSSFDTVWWKLLWWLVTH